MHKPKLEDEGHYQEINVWSKNKMRVEIQICQINMRYELEVNRRSVEWDPIFNSSVCKRYYSATEDAFEEGIGYAKDYIFKKVDVIDKIDNPCNAPFISRISQIDILSKKGLNVPVFVNGKKN